MHLHAGVALRDLHLRQSPCRGERPELPDLHPSELETQVTGVSDDARQRGEIVLATGDLRRIRHTCTLPPTTDIHPRKIGRERPLCTPRK